MTSLPAPILDLIGALSKLPGIGPRSAERIALFLVQSDSIFVQRLADALLQAKQRIQLCNQCGALTESQPCPICSAPDRDPSLVCVVERPVDVLNIERAGTFHGRYHVLGGKISPVSGVGPEDLRVAQLESRLSREPIRELILALGSDVEGDATGFFLAQQFRDRGLKITRIAQGLPVGSGLEFADELTLSRAIEGRREL